MPRVGSDSVVTHRIELGVWERKRLEESLVPMQLQNTAKAVGYIAAGGAMCLASYGLYWFFDSGWGITKKIKQATENWYDSARQGNPLYLSPLELDLNDPDVQARLDEADGDPLIWNYPKRAWSWIKGGLGI